MTVRSQIALLLLTTIFIRSSSGFLSVIQTDISDSSTYSLFYDIEGISYQRALNECHSRNTVLATEPIPYNIAQTMKRYISARKRIWIAKSGNNCRTIEQSCPKRTYSSIGSSRCQNSSLGDYKDAPCGTQYKHMMCRTEVRRLVTTTITVPTTVPTTVPITIPTTQTTPTTPPPITRKTTSPNLYSTVYRRTRATKRPIQDVMVDHISKTLTMISASDKSMLGLIMAVVAGSFFITVLFIGVCYVCRSKSNKQRQKRYELIHGLSNVTIHNRSVDRSVDRSTHSPGSTSGRQAETTTEETSLTDHDMSSERSYTHRDPYEVPPYPISILPPPPQQIYENTTTASVYDIRPPASYASSSISRKCKTMDDQMCMHPYMRPVDNIDYASITRGRMPLALPIQTEHDSHSHYDDLPLPPPPPQNHPPALPKSNPPSRTMSRNSSMGYAPQSESIELVATNL